MRLSRAACGALAFVAVMMGSWIAKADPPSPSRLAFDIQLLVSPQLSAPARGALIAEADRIWRREGVYLNWYRSRDMSDAPPPAQLRVLVVDGAASATNDRWSVAELVPIAAGRAIAIASIDGARRVLGDAPALTAPESEARERRLGLVLGRAVAHEIGHFLLGSAHSARGLMREGFDAREFADLRGGEAFHLDAETRRGVRQRVLALSRPPRN